MPYTDKQLTCQDCGTQFTFSVEDQEYHATRGFSNEPKRCQTCRQSRRSEGGGGSYSSAPRQLYPAVCAECGAATEVPFQPRDDRPVYCRACYAKRQPARSRY